jgi:hypothetical protein
MSSRDAGKFLQACKRLLCSRSNSYKNAFRQAEPFAAMIKALMPAIEELGIFSLPDRRNVSADALINTFVPGRRIRSMESSDDESVSSVSSDSDG